MAVEPDSGQVRVPGQPVYESEELRQESFMKNINMQETLGQLIKRRMYDLRIYTAAELARRIGYSRSYVTQLVNDTAPTRRGRYLPEPRVVKKLSENLAVSETEILKAMGYLS